LRQFHVFHGLSSEHGHFAHQIGQIFPGQVTGAGCARRTNLPASLADDGCWTETVTGGIDQELTFLGRQEVVRGKDGWIGVDLLQSWIQDVDAIENGCDGIDVTASARRRLLLMMMILIL
jgi:hypothetical protein